MDDRIRHALSRGHRIDITTTGRKTGRPRRIEVVFHNFDGHIYISGRPGRRGWYANLVADPRMTFHLKGPVQADLPARARPITQDPERRDVIERISRAWKIDPDALHSRSPLIEVELEEAAAA
jgi:deazaflavin-dependent oxidoreductase (nitroreductase family)